MPLVTLVFKGKMNMLILLIVLGLCSGGLHVWLLIILNEKLSQLLQGGKVELFFLLKSVALLLAYLLLNWLLSRSMIEFSQKIIHDVRMQLMRSALHAEYVNMKQKQELLFSAITKDTIALSQAGLSCIHLITSLVTVVGCLLYLAYLSLTVLLFITVIAVVGIGIYLWSSSKNLNHLKNARESEDSLFYHIRQVIDGFREVKINLEKGNDLVEGPLQDASLSNYYQASKGFMGYYTNSLISQLLFYLALIGLLFSGGTFLTISPTELMNCVVVTLYLVGPLEAVTTLMPNIAAGNVAALRLNEMLATFCKLENPPQDQEIGALDFNQLRYQSLRYTYPVADTSLEPGFSLGPIHFQLNKGEVAFIYGGNGAGKTTFLHLILGLLKAQQGEVFLNEKAIISGNVPTALYAPVFSDFHLFDRLYGIALIDAERVNRYLKLFEMEEKISFDQHRFSSLKLSAGQRKRLALIAILLENRPILFLDEWAADQDPTFRAKFYCEIIPALKAEGLTILAITHDDKYYEKADSLYQMDAGELIKER